MPEKEEKKGESWRRGFQQGQQDLIEDLEKMNNFRQAKVDGKDDWNDALEQSARKVDALIKKYKK